MEHRESATLAQEIVRAPLPVQELLRRALDLATAVTRFHRRPRVHGGIEPASIILSSSGVELAEPVSGRFAITPYTAPEQFRGVTDARSDIFAFGAVVYEMATGWKAYAGDTPDELKTAILEKQPPPIASLRTDPASATFYSGLNRVVSSCMVKNPDQRRQRMQNVLVDLKLMSSMARAIPATPSAGATPPAAVAPKPLAAGAEAVPAMPPAGAAPPVEVAPKSMAAGAEAIPATPPAGAAPPVEVAPKSMAAGAEAIPATPPAGTTPPVEVAPASPPQALTKPLEPKIAEPPKPLAAEAEAIPFQPVDPTRHVADAPSAPPNWPALPQLAPLPVETVFPRSTEQNPAVPYFTVEIATAPPAAFEVDSPPSAGTAGHVVVDVPPVLSGPSVAQNEATPLAEVPPPVFGSAPVVLPPAGREAPGWPFDVFATLAIAQAAPSVEAAEAVPYQQPTVLIPDRHLSSPTLQEQADGVEPPPAEPERGDVEHEDSDILSRIGLIPPAPYRIDPEEQKEHGKEQKEQQKEKKERSRVKIHLSSEVQKRNWIRVFKIVAIVAAAALLALAGMAANALLRKPSNAQVFCGLVCPRPAQAIHLNSPAISPGGELLCVFRGQFSAAPVPPCNSARKRHKYFAERG